MSEGAAGWDEPAAAPDELIDDDRGGPVHTPASAAGEGGEDRERGGTQNGNTSGERRNHHAPLVSEGPQPQAATGGGHRQQQNRTPVAGVHASPIHSNVSPLQKIAERHSGQPPANGAVTDGNFTDVPLESDSMWQMMTKKTLLHGTLSVWLYEARQLPNMDLTSERLRQCFSFLPSCKTPFVRMKNKAKEHTHGHHPKGITSDPYASVVLAGARVARTRVISNNASPTWDEHFKIPVAHYVDAVEISIKDDDMLGAQYIGSVTIPVEQVIDGQVIEGWHDVLNSSGNICHEGAQCRFKLVFTPVQNDPLFTQGVGGDGHDNHMVPDTYFPCRKGCDLTLYQDAHIFDGSLPEVMLEDGVKFHQHRCWEELCTAILDAHHMVYIAGWSIYHQVKLLRDNSRPIPEGGNLTLGELLKRKSAEGVRVLVLAWDDKTSHNNIMIKNEGLMGVHDEDTKRYFKNTAVRCVLAPRYGDSKLSWFRQQVVGTLYTHHQKLIIMDTQSTGGSSRKLTSFIGGLDLCDGRWDTPTHSLFATLQTLHKNDYHDPTFTTMAEAGGPRQPWHDWHCKIEGPAAYDILTNFEQRWRKATRWHDDELIQLERISWILSPKQPQPPEGDPNLYVTEHDAKNTWHVQVFRSIDSGSARGFPKGVVEAEKQHLIWGKNIAIDISIQMAYIKAIRSAQHFVYIENQYFIGSSYNWPDYANAGANQLIPMELALKIASKIKAGERFAVYVIIPMWPEGVPDSVAMQEILYFQAQTMKMMYGVIANALREKGLLGKCHPREFLNFYCLGNREVQTSVEPNPQAPPPANSKQALVQKNRRFMIYVHAKGMVVDDEYVICGSANINQRSMDGSRDTEIAMGGYQPHFTWAQKNGQPLGQVYGHRMSLWAEHLGVLEPAFTNPESLECVQRVNEMAQANWEQYIAEEVTDMRAHLLPYPVQVNDDGTLGALPGYETFPDVGGLVLGASQGNLPDGLTT